MILFVYFMYYLLFFGPRRSLVYRLPVPACGVAIHIVHGGALTGVRCLRAYAISDSARFLPQPESHFGPTHSRSTAVALRACHDPVWAIHLSLPIALVDAQIESCRDLLANLSPIIFNRFLSRDNLVYQ